MTNKKWYLSKIIWVNAIALVAVMAQTITGKEIVTPELQVMALSVVNLVLRSITKENIVW
ncbi:hypothetical protein [Clostridium sp.]|jgi:hypothetical protein|uniref:hypothetical protein n=1 Tax=Clostridium sp. TaxID=1506 RepID=UPI003EE89FA0